MFAIAIAMCCVSAMAGQVVYVDDDAPAGGNGFSWASALTHVHDALVLAADPQNGVSEIHIAQGVYRPDRSAANPLGSRDRNSTFAMISGVAIRGGYLGLSAQKGQVPDQRDLSLYRTIFSGDLEGDDGPGLYDNAGENAYQVVVAIDVDGTGILDGVTVCAGHADGPGFGATPLSRDQGAGANVYFGGPQFLNCQFRGNWNNNHGAVNDHGYTSYYSNCSFVDNHAEAFGAGLYFHHDTQCIADNCLFEDNTTPGQGGGAYSRSLHEAKIINSFFAGNSAVDGAGMYNAPDSTTHLVNCIFDNNTAVHGGGTYLHVGTVSVDQCTFFFNASEEGGGIFVDDGSPTVTHCQFTRNIGTGGGGGMWNAAGTPSVSGCSFLNNTSENGGGAGVYNGDSGTPIIARCTFRGNAGIEGGGMYNFFADAVVSDCEFSDNLAVGGAFSVGGGLLNYFSYPSVINCNIYRNTAELGGGGIYNEGGLPMTINCRINGNIANGETEGWGGGVMNGYFTHALFINCSLAGNSANRGGGIFNMTFSQPRIVNCTLVANHAVVSGGGIQVYGGAQPTSDNCVVWHNSPTQIEGDPAPVRYSCIEGGFVGVGNVAGDPMIARMPEPGNDVQWGTTDDDYGDLNITRGSSCIDAGDDVAVPDGVFTDLGGHSRFVDDRATPDSGVAGNMHPVVDIGALERQVSGCLADIAPMGRGDGIVGVDDLVLVLTQWGAAGGHGPADVAPPGGDGTVDLNDLFTVINGWGLCP